MGKQAPVPGDLSVQLSKRPAIYELPSYSLTADLLGFLRCGLQYRYTRLSRLTPSRPVQMWFGQFVHGVLEEAFRRYSAARARGDDAAPPWDTATLEEIRNLVKGRLASQGLHAWDADLEELGDRRSDAAVNELGAALFPLIHRAEVRLTGSRALPSIASELQFREADRYEIVGVVDVISHVTLQDPALEDNLLVQLLKTALGDLPRGIRVDHRLQGHAPSPRSEAQEPSRPSGKSMAGNSRLTLTCDGRGGPPTDCGWSDPLPQRTRPNQD